MATSSVERLRQLEQAVEADRQLQDMETRLALVVQRVASCHPLSPPSSPFPFGLGYADIALGVNIGLLGWLVMVRLLGHTLPVLPTKSEMRSQPLVSVTVPTSHSEPRTPHSPLPTPLHYPFEKLFATKRSPGSIAVSVAEGRLSADGQHEDQSDEDDPGNHALNRGFCNWNHADGLTYAQADAHCLAALQHQAAATIHNLRSVGIEPTVELVVNGTDLWNQSNQAGEAFAQHFKEVFEEVRSINEDSLTAARVEAFRNSANQLDASGLFSICSRYPYYQTRLQAYASYPESWKWECIALDQRRRVQAVHKSLRLNVEAKKTGLLRHQKDVIHLVQPAVVTVHAQEIGAGSIIGASGLVLTCHHLVGGNSQVEVKTASGQRLTGHVISNDLLNDLALVQLNTQKPLPTVRLATLSLKPGQKVYAIGSPYGHPGVITSGSFRRMTGGGDLQTTTGLLKPGNSGGPLLNAHGELIGVNKGLLDDQSGLATGVLTAKRFIHSIAN